jgi:16S rRNA (cytosine967-C5)-methyltransferase
LVYATCSVLPAENERQIEAFLERHPEFAVVPVVDVWRDAQGAEPPAEISTGPYLRLSPLRHGTDGFFAATLLRHPDRSRAERGEVEGPDLSPDLQDEVPRLRDPAGRSARDDGE